MDNIETTLEKLFTIPYGTYTVFTAREGCGVRVALMEKKDRLFLDTDLFSGYSRYDYTDKGIEHLKYLAEASQYSDGIKLESQTKRVFQISLDNDILENQRNSIGVWLGLLEQTIQNDDFVIDLSLNI